MKKVLLLASFMLLAVVLVGCVDKTTTTVSTVPPTTTAPVVTTVPTDTDPVINGASDVTIEKGTAFVPLQGITATDVEDGDLTSSVTYSGNVNVNAVGVYTATYTVVDSDGNITVVNRKVTVIFTDTQAPLISGTANKIIFVGQSFDPLLGISANDTVDGSVTVTYTGSVNVWSVGKYTLSYSAKDAANNPASATREITVTFGDFVFGDEVNIPAANFTTAGEVMSSPAIVGGVINEAIAEFTYLKLMITASSATAGTINVALGSLDASATELAIGTTAAEQVVYFVLTAPLTDAVLTIDTNGLTLADLNVDYAFAEIRDMVAPVLTVPAGDIAHAAGKSLVELEANLRAQVTAVDDIDGNLTSSIVIDLSAFDVDAIGEQEVVYSVTDAGGNVTTQTRTVIVGNLVDAGYLTDPTFENAGDGLWREKSNDGKATLVFDDVTNTMNITVTNLGNWLSAAGTYFKESSAGLEVDQWYMFTFTVKTTIARQMGFRMGLVTDSANGWIDDFNGRNNMMFNLTNEYQTFSVYFKLDSLVSSDGSELFTIELNLGQNSNWNMPGKDGVTTFKDVAMYKVVTEFDPPTYETHVGADLPVKFTEGDTAPDWSKYVTFMDMSKTVLTPVINSTAVNMAAAGTYDVVYTATDIRNKSTTYTLTITVLTEANSDTTGPVVTLKEGVPTSVDQFTDIKFDLTKLVDVVDAVDGIMTVLPEMVDDGGLNLRVAGTYTVTITAYDLSGNITVFEQEVTVVDKQGPKINVGDWVLNIGDAFDGLKNVTVVDNIDGSIDLSELTITGLDAFVTDGFVTLFGDFELTYTVEDALGNITTLIVKVKVANIVWDEDTRTPLGTPDEGPTHSTAAFDETEQAIKISGIDPNTDSWDHARWVYYFTQNTDLVLGHTYKFEIRVKADQATNIYFRVGATLSADPWIDNYTGGLQTIAVGTEYTTYSIIFTVDKAFVDGTAKFQFMYGYLQSDATNNIYIKHFDLVEEQQPIVENVANIISGSTITGTVTQSTATYDDTEKAVLITDIPAFTYDWMVGRITKSFDNTQLVFGETYRFKIVAKATTATDLRVRIGTTLGAEPWIDNFEGGLSRFGITTTYDTYYVYFTVDKENYVTANSAKMEFDYGLLTDEENTIYIKEFAIERYYFPLVEDVDYVQVDGFDYADEAAMEVAWKNRINGVNQTGDAPLLSYEPINGALVLTLPAVANNGWFLVRRMASLASIGVTDDFKTLAFYMTNNTNVTTMGVWLYWGGTQNSFNVTLPAIGESGWVTINVQTASGALPTAITDVAFGFNNWSASPVTGSITVYDIIAVKDVSVLGKYPVEIIDTNEAPVISMSDANKAVLAGTTLKAGESLETLIPTILSMIQINDPEDGVITATAGMINVGNLNITNPTMGTYDLVVNVSDSKGKAAIAYTLKLSVVTVIDDFEAYVLDQGYSATAKGDFTRLYAFRSDGSSWTVSPAVVGTLIDNSGNKMFSVAYKYVNGNMNGIRINVTKAELEALGAQYIGIYLKTSAPLSSGSKFQFFKYSASATEVTAVGTSSFADEGTYVWIAVSQLDKSTTSVAFMMNVVSTDSGTLYLDNIVIK